MKKAVNLKRCGRLQFTGKWLKNDAKNRKKLNNRELIDGNIWII